MANFTLAQVLRRSAIYDRSMSCGFGKLTDTPKLCIGCLLESTLSNVSPGQSVDECEVASGGPRPGNESFYRTVTDGYDVLLTNGHPLVDWTTSLQRWFGICFR